MIKSRGFTLIELLVVILVIGILIAIALPRYRVAVERSRLAHALPVLNSIYKGLELYILERGYPYGDRITGSLISDYISAEYPLTSGEYGFCEQNFRYDISCYGNNNCDVALKRMPSLDNNGECVVSSYPLYIVLLKHSTNKALNEKSCTAYPSFAKTYYSLPESLPVDVCNMLKDTGAVNRININQN